MVDEAKTHAEEDKNKKEAVETRNQAESMVYSTEKSLKEHGDKLDPKDKETTEKAIEELKEVLKDESAAADNIKTKLEALNTAAMKLGEVMYKENQKSSPGGESGQENTKKADANADAKNSGNEEKAEDIVEADFEEVKEDKEKKSN